MTPATAPASRVSVLATASLMVGIMTALLPVINHRVDARSIAVVGWIPSLLAAHLGWASHVGAIRERFVSRDIQLRPRDDAFSIAVINPRVLTAIEHPSRFQSYILCEFGITALLWIALIGPAVFPLFMRLGDALGLGSVG
jgi:hypothetical protein